MADPSTVRVVRRHGLLALLIAGTCVVLMGAFVLLWFKLPTWAPAWVVVHSPWADPIVRAVEAKSDLMHEAAIRLINRGSTITPTMVAYLESGRPVPINLASLVLREVIDSRMIAPVVRVMMQENIYDGSVFERGLLREALAKQDASLVTDVILPISKDRTPSTRNVITLAGSLPDVRVVRALEAIIWEPPLPEKEAQVDRFSGRGGTAARALVMSPIKEAQDIIIRALTDVAPHVRLRAIFGIMQGDANALDKRLVATLAACLCDTDAKVRRLAAWSAADIALPGAEDELSSWLHASDPADRSAAIRGLGSTWASPLVIGYLAHGLSDIHQVVRMTAVDALVHTGNPAVVDPLLAAYSTAEVGLKTEILNALNVKPLSEDPRVFDFILGAMDDPQQRVRKMAERVLNWMTMRSEHAARREDLLKALRRRAEPP